MGQKKDDVTRGYTPPLRTIFPQYLKRPVHQRSNPLRAFQPFQIYRVKAIRVFRWVWGRKCL